MRLRLLCIAVFLPFLLDLSLLGAEEKKWKKVNWLEAYEEEILLEIMESAEYSPEDKEKAFTWFPGINSATLKGLKRFLKVPTESLSLGRFGIFIRVPFILESMEPLSRREGTILFHDYCYRVMRGDDEYHYDAVTALMKTGDFVPVLDTGNPYEKGISKDDAYSLYVGCCGFKHDMKVKWRLPEFVARAKVEYRAFLDALMYSVCELDWKAKLAPDAKMQSEIDRNVELLGSEDPEKRKDAREALLKTGIPAYPAIAKAKDNPDVEVRSSCEWLLEQYPLTIPARVVGYIEKFHLDRDVLFLAALLDVKDDALHKAAHEKLKKITGADLSDKREEWKKWHSENAPYAEWCEKQGKYGIVKHAKESKAPLSRWELIPEEQRKNWDELEEPDRKRLIEEAEKKYQEAIEKETSDKLPPWLRKLREGKDQKKEEPTKKKPEPEKSEQPE